MTPALSNFPTTVLAIASQASNSPFLHAPMYDRLANHLPNDHEREAAAEFIQTAILQTSNDEKSLPNEPEHLVDWMNANVENVHAQYQTYLAERKDRAARRYFTNRSQKGRWILRNRPSEESRFWQLLQGGRAEMFGVFTGNLRLDSWPD